MKFKVLFCLLLILSAVLIGGCWDRTEVDDISLVLGMGIDRVPGDEPILLTAQIINPGAQKTGMGVSGLEKPFFVQSIKGETIFDAVRNFVKISPRKLFFAHSKVIIFGREFAENDIKEVIDYLSRDREIRSTNWIFVAEKTAKEVLETKMDIEKVTARGIESLLTTSGRFSYTYPINENEFLFRLFIDDQTSIAPIIELINPMVINKTQEGENTGKSEKSEKEASKRIILGNKTAIFQKYKMIGFLNQNESKGLFWLSGKINNDTVVIPFPNKKEGQKISINDIKAKTTIVPKLTSGNISMKITCKGEGALREAENVQLGITDVEKFKKIESEVDKVIKDRIEETINKAQKDLRADFIGFATQIHNNYPYDWKELSKDWDQIFPDIKYDVSVDITLVKTGLIKDSIEESIRKGKDK